jgi:quercetin dioxygenase-like cupin family protein
LGLETGVRQIVVVLHGRLTFLEGEATHRLLEGDCLELGPPADCAFRNDSGRTCTYLVGVIRQ